MCPTVQPSSKGVALLTRRRLVVVTALVLTTAWCPPHACDAWSLTLPPTMARTMRPSEQSIRHQVGVLLVPRRNRHLELTSLPAPYFDTNDDRAASKVEPRVVDAPNASLWQRLDEAGMALKPAALRAHEHAMAIETAARVQRVLWLAWSTGLYTAFILYRGYRGCFVILPAVFRETVRKLQTAVDATPFDSSTDSVDVPRTNWRTQGTIGLLASIVTLTYVIGGGVRVGRTFVTTALSGTRRRDTTVVLDSLQAAAREQERNEQSILAKTQHSAKLSAEATNINGTKDRGGLAP